MALFKVVVEAYVASREMDQASLSRLVFWVDVLGDRSLLVRKVGNSRRFELPCRPASETRPMATFLTERP